MFVLAQKFTLKFSKLNLLCAIGLNYPLKPREGYRIEEKKYRKSMGLDFFGNLYYKLSPEALIVCQEFF